MFLFYILCRTIFLRTITLSMRIHFNNSETTPLNFHLDTSTFSKSRLLNNLQENSVVTLQCDPNFKIQVAVPLQATLFIILHNTSKYLRRRSLIVYLKMSKTIIRINLLIIIEAKNGGNEGEHHYLKSWNKIN